MNCMSFLLTFKNDQKTELVAYKESIDGMMIFGSWLFFATVLSTSACFFHRSIIISLSVQGEGFYPNIANHMYVKYIYKSVAVLVLVTQLKRLIISCTRKTIAYPEYVVRRNHYCSAPNLLISSSLKIWISNVIHVYLFRAGTFL
ncbi:unnamed protein product [Albugo candida]|uniref:Uncharacterized protein n=1 Tax=Albugo candida TaxID=65357 RepID=A0A024FYB5_9STRA|nr:unnamed protein product [Albugo candida]|eukprot:CCI39382.1 unnamed protein product [Albugo candida]